MKGPNLSAMSVDDLLELRDRVSQILANRVQSERRELETRLARLQSVAGSALGGDRRAKVAPKYRNPENPSETWTGRGLRPRWLAAALKSGKKLTDFQIAGTAVAAPSHRRKRKSKTAH
jgi:DNA-binding protein H-NS